jgi:hypothetical protein
MTTTQEDLIAKNKAADNMTEAEVAELLATEPQEPSDPLDSREVQIAAGQYANFVKQIKGRARTMKGGGLARVLIAVSEFPYAESYPRFLHQAETELFLLMTSNGKAKAVIANALQSQESTLQNIAIDNMTNKILEGGKV